MAWKIIHVTDYTSFTLKDTFHSLQFCVKISTKYSGWIHFYKTPRVEDWRTFKFELNMELAGQSMTWWLEWSTEWGTFTKDVTVIIDSIFFSWQKEILWKFNQVNNLSQVFLHLFASYLFSQLFGTTVI